MQEQSAHRNPSVARAVAWIPQLLVFALLLCAAPVWASECLDLDGDCIPDTLEEDLMRKFAPLLRR